MIVVHESGDGDLSLIQGIGLVSWYPYPSMYALFVAWDRVQPEVWKLPESDAVKRRRRQAGLSGYLSGRPVTFLTRTDAPKCHHND